MKRQIFLFFIFLTIISCNEVSFYDSNYITDETVVAIKIDPPVSIPGSEIEISAAVDDGKGNTPLTDISVGNIVFAEKSSAKVNIPSDISYLLGEETKKELVEQGFTDVPVKFTLKNSAKISVKTFRIYKSNDNTTTISANPLISALQYEVIGSAEKTDVNKDETIFFSPNSIPESVSFVPEKTLQDKNDKNEYVFSWFISSSTDYIPEMIDFDKKTGTALFSFRDESNAPLVGTYKFYILLKPLKSFAGTEKACYGSDFFVFTVDTNGE